MREYKVPKRRKNESGKVIVNTIVAAIAACFALVAAIKLYTMMLPPIKNLDEYRPNVVTQIYADDGEIIKTFTAFTSERVSIDEIPDELKKAIIATEDKNFYSHDGYDLTGLARSMIANIQAGRLVQGASTITQQLARLLFLNNEKTYDRKIKEFILSARIEKSLPKDKILEMYLNNVYLGSGAYGVAGAAKVYFNKPLKNLTLAESALIAGLPQAPSVYSPFNDLDKAISRRNQVLKRMYKMRYITKEQYNKAKEEKVHLNPLPSIYVYNKAPYFVDYVMKELENMGFDETDITQGGYKIYTTLDSKAQNAANAALVANLRGKNQGAVFSFSPTTGAILAFAGGKDYGKSQYDRITHSVRPPGSSFKPIVYAAAVEKGWGPNDILDDKPITIGKWSPRNYGSRYRGPIPLYAGLMISSNVMAVRLIQDVGIRSVISLARSLGISTPLEYDSTIALGSNGVKLYDLTVVYGAFANGGFKVTPYAITRVETNRGKVVYQAPKTRAVKAISYETAATMTAMLKTVITSGTGRGANIGVPSAAKTGTTDDYRDAWFVGYTPDIVTGVWMGNDDNSVMQGMTGGMTPAIIWRDVMKAATAKYGAHEFEYPEVQIDFVRLPSSMSVAQVKEKEEQEKAEDEKQQAESESITVDPQQNLPAPQITPIKMQHQSTTQNFSEVFNNNVQNQQKSAPPAAKQPVAAPIPGGQ